MTTIFLILIYIISIPLSYFVSMMVLTMKKGNYENKNIWLVFLLAFCPIINTVITACIIFIFLLIKAA